jgi:hypothetical protein
MFLPKGEGERRHGIEWVLESLFRGWVGLADDNHMTFIHRHKRNFVKKLTGFLVIDGRVGYRDKFINITVHQIQEAHIGQTMDVAFDFFSGGSDDGVDFNLFDHAFISHAIKPP